MTMFVTFTAATLLALLAGCLFLVQSAQTRPNRILALLFALFSVHMGLLTFRFWEGRLEAFGLTSVIATCIGPVIYSYFIAVLRDWNFDALYILRHSCLIGIMVVLQLSAIGSPLMKDFIVLGSLTFYSVALLRNLVTEGLSKSNQTDNAKRIFRFLKMLAGFLIIITVADYMIFFEFVWLGNLNPQYALVAATLFLAVLSLMATYVGLSRSPLVSWMFAAKYAVHPVEGTFTFEEKQEALVKLNALIETEQAHLNSNASVQVFAALMGVPDRLLSQAVNQIYGKTFRRHINDLRIEAAKTKLATSKDTILSIMFEVGFETKSNFNREFHQSVGVSPNEYRKNMLS